VPSLRLRSAEAGPCHPTFETGSPFRRETTPLASTPPCSTACALLSPRFHRLRPRDPLAPHVPVNVAGSEAQNQPCTPNILGLSSKKPRAIGGHAADVVPVRPAKLPGDDGPGDGPRGLREAPPTPLRLSAGPAAEPSRPSERPLSTGSVQVTQTKRPGCSVVIPSETTRRPTPRRLRRREYIV